MFLLLFLLPVMTVQQTAGFETNKLQGSKQ